MQEQLDPKTMIEGIEAMRAKYAVIEREIAQLRQEKAAMQEASFYKFLNDIPVGIYHSTSDGRFIFANHALARLLGYESVEELMRKDIAQDVYFSPAERDEMQEKMRLSSDNSVVFRVRKKTGEELWVEEHGHIARDENGRARYYEGVLLDASARREAEAALKASESRYRSLVENLPDGIFRSTRSGKFLTVNPALVKMLGYKNPEELLAIDIAKDLYFDPSERDAAIENYHERKGETLLSHLRKKDGSEIWVEERALEVSDSDADNLGYAGVLRDVTERKQIEDALQTIAESISPLTGDDFFKSLARHLAMALKAPHAIITERVEPEKTRVRTLAFWSRDAFKDPYEYELKGTPCEKVIAGEDRYYAENVQSLFPDDQDLVELNATGYVGVPLFDSRKFVIGHMAVIDDTMFSHQDKSLSILKIFAARAGAEIERKRHEQKERRQFEQLQTINKLYDSVGHAENIDDIYQAALASLRQGLGVERAAVLVADEDGAMRFKAWRGISSRYRSEVDGHSPWAKDDPLPAPVLVHNVELDERLGDLRIPILEENIRAIAFIPLVYRRRFHGKFMLYYDKPHTFSAEDVQLAQTIAGQVAFALEQFNAAQELRCSKERFQVLFNSAPDMYFLFEPSGKILDVNEKVVELLGYERAELVGSIITDYMHPDDVPAAVEIVRSVLRHNAARQPDEIRFINRAGEEIWCGNELSVVRNEQNGLNTIQAACRDITEKRILQEKVARAHRLESAGRVAGQIAHDFNNLLAPLTAYPALVREDLAEGKPVESLVDEMEAAALKIAEINQQLLALGRRGHYNMEPLDVNELVQTLLSSKDFPGAITIRRELSPDLPRINGGAAQLTRAITNLLNNAVEAMNGNGLLTIRTEILALEQPMHRLQTVPPGAYVHLSISDEGSGIDPRMSDRIFEPFFTTKKMDKIRGSGLGLSIVHGVVEDHGGYIALDSRPGEGTTFSLYFPTTNDGAKTTSDGESAVGSGGERILVVDDDAIQSTVITELLKRLGYAVERASSGMTAVAKSMRTPYDLLILDMVLEDEIDGTETFRRILELRPKQRAIIMSGFAMSQRVQEALNLGAHTFIPKPVRQHQLAKAVRSAIEAPARPTA